VEGHQAYKLKLGMKNGEERHVWVDAATFLERKIDGDPEKWTASFVASLFTIAITRP